MHEVREKRGLAYSVYSYLQPYDSAAIFAGAVLRPRTKRWLESLDVIQGPDQASMAEQTDQARPSSTTRKSYLTGSYALRFDTSSKIASQLLGIQQVGTRHRLCQHAQRT